MSAFRVPTADGHVHANGMLDDETVLILADKYKVDLKTYSPHIIESGTRIWPSYKLFHKAYYAGVSLIREPDDLRFVVKKYLTRVARDNCVYVDIFASGMNNYSPPLGEAWPFFEKNTSAALEAMKEAYAETGIESSLVITFKRHLKDAVKAADELVTLTHLFKEAGLDGEDRINAFHLAGDEQSGPPVAAFAPVYHRAHTELKMNRNGLHVGETGTAESIWSALDISEAWRFGHALSAARDEKLMDTIRDHGVAIEILRKSNKKLLGIQPEDHPIHAFLACGIDIILGSDDPGILNTHIANEYNKAAKEFGLSDKQLFGFTMNAVRHGFAPLARRQKVMNHLAEENARLGMGLDPSAFQLTRIDEPKIASRNLLHGLLMKRAPTAIL